MKRQNNYCFYWLMKTKLWLVLLTTLLISQSLSQPIYAQTVRQLTLKECVEYAVANNKNNLNARVDEFIAQEKVNELLAVGYPQLSANADLRYNAIIPTSLVPAEVFGGQKGQFAQLKFGTNWNTTAGFTLNQLVFDGTFFLGVKAAKEYVELTRRSNKRTEVETAVTIHKAYYTVLVADHRLNLLKNSIQQLESLSKNTQALLDNGFAEKLDVDRINVNLNNARTELEKARRMVDLSRLLLKFQMGMPVDDVLEPVDKININDMSTVYADTSFTPNIENRVEYSMLTKSMDLQNLNVKRLKVGYYPTVMFYGSLQTQAQRQTFDIFDTSKRWFPVSSFGLQFNIKLFDGFQRKALIQQASLERVKVENEIKNLKNAVQFEYRDAKIRMTNSSRDLQIQKRNMELATEVYRVTDLKFREGIGTNIEVINADIELKQSQTNYVNALLETYLARVDLQKSLGTLYIPE